MVQEIGMGAATTLAVVEIREHTLRPYHVGESMILVVGQRGKSKLQTVSHSPVGFAVESGLLDAVEAMHHEDRHLVSNVVGNADMRIEIGPCVELAPRDTLLLASAGLFDNLHLPEIVELLRKGPLPDAVRSLAAEARRRMQCPQDGHPSKPDDLTIVAWRPNRRTETAGDFAE
jgi:PPM family protein phosphatase